MASNVRTMMPNFFSGGVDSEMVMAPRSNSAFDFIMSNLQRFHNNMTNDINAQKPYVFGGYVRDKLLGVEPTDMDIFATSRVIEEFVKFLQASERLVAYRRNVNDITTNEKDYYCFKIQVEIPGRREIVSIDLVTDQHMATSRTRVPFNSTTMCDFTCNNLVMYYGGLLSSRVLIDGMTREETTILCVQDTLHRRLNNMYSVPDIVEQNTSTVHDLQLCSYQKYLLRTQKMKSKGFEFREDGGTHCVPIPVIQLPDNATTFLQRGEAASTMMCAICQCDYDQESIHQTTVCECGHHYHTMCIQRWRRSGRPSCSRCPTCRSELAYRFSTTQDAS